MELSKTDKQIIWDALTVYREYCDRMTHSKHFARDTFKEIRSDTDDLRSRLFVAWDKDICH